MSPRIFTIKLAGFSSIQSSTFQSVLNLAESRLLDQWHIVEDEADFWLFPQEPFPTDLPNERCLFYTTKPNLSACILISEKGFPRLNSVVTVLNSLSSIRLTTPDNITSEETPLTTAEANPLFANFDTFAPNQGLLKHLLQIKASGELSSIVANNINILIDPVAGLFYASISLEEFIFCSYPDVEVFNNGLAAADFQQFVDESQLPPRPLSDLIWYITVKTSQGLLLAGHSPDEIVTLANWPNLKLPECRGFIKLAAFMHSNALPLREIAQKQKLPLEDCYNFYNACYLTGLIKKPTAVQIHNKPINPERKRIFDAIKNLTS